MRVSEVMLTVLYALRSILISAVSSSFNISVVLYLFVRLFCHFGLKDVSILKTISDLRVASIFSLLVLSVLATLPSVMGVSMAAEIIPISLASVVTMGE